MRTVIQILEGTARTQVLRRTHAMRIRLGVVHNLERGRIISRPPTVVQRRLVNEVQVSRHDIELVPDGVAGLNPARQEHPLGAPQLVVAVVSARRRPRARSPEYVVVVARPKPQRPSRDGHNDLVLGRGRGLHPVHPMAIVIVHGVLLVEHGALVFREVWLQRAERISPARILQVVGGREAQREIRKLGEDFGVPLEELLAAHGAPVAPVAVRQEGPRETARQEAGYGVREGFEIVAGQCSCQSEDEL